MAISEKNCSTCCQDECPGLERFGSGDGECKNYIDEEDTIEEKLIEEKTKKI